VQNVPIRHTAELGDAALAPAIFVRRVGVVLDPGLRLICDWRDGDVW
jgi:hypothetical protein